MHTPGLDDEVLMLLPFLLVPLEIFLVTKIMKQTPFIVKETVSQKHSEFNTSKHMNISKA